MNLDSLPSHQKKRIEIEGYLTRGDIADLLKVTKECIKYYEKEGVLVADATNKFNTRLYKLETAEAFIQWHKTKSIYITKSKFQTKPKTQDEIEWENYSRELHL